MQETERRHPFAACSRTLCLVVVFLMIASCILVGSPALRNGATEIDHPSSRAPVNTASVGTVFDLTILPGWNLVTVPLVGYGYRASNLGLQKLDMVACLNSSTQTYDKVYIVGVSPPSFDFPIEESTGYWIHTTASKVLHLYGSVPTTTQVRSVALPIRGGWVDLGLNTLISTWKASKIPTMFTGGKVTAVASYSPITKVFKTYITGVPPSDFTLVPGQAYEVFCTASGVFSYAPTSAPIASFTCTMNGTVVNVDASKSSAETGIASYTWDWGDGTVPDLTTSPIATHAYGVTQGTIPLPPDPGGPPGFPHTVFGFTYDSDGSSPISGCTVTITNKRTGEFITNVSDESGFYSVDVSYVYRVGAWWITGDKLEVTAIKDAKFGSNWGILDYNEFYQWIDVTLRAPGPRLITLTVKDMIGQTNTTAQTVVVPGPPIASFVYSVNSSTINVDASGSSKGIVNYTWSWGDGTTGYGMKANHTYKWRGTPDSPLVYSVGLVVRDSLSQSAGVTKNVNVPPYLLRSFIFTANGPTVNVDASWSRSDAGIASYTWNWGDGTAPEVSLSPIASHTYVSTPPLMTPLTNGSDDQTFHRWGIPSFPFMVYGYVYGPDGVTLLPDCNMIITNKMTGEFIETLSWDGIYSGDINEGVPTRLSWGDVVNVTAVKGTMIGWGEYTCDPNDWGAWLDITMSGQGKIYWITLTITDTVGQTSSMSRPIVWTL